LHIYAPSYSYNQKNQLKAVLNMLDLSISNGITRLAPEKELELIAFHGFTHIHWSLHFSGDYLYSSSEIAHYAGMLKNSGVQIQDLHAPCGSEKCFYAAEKFRRCAGVDMILNRAELLVAMDVPQASLVVHIPNMNDIFETKMEDIAKRLKITRQTVSKYLKFFEDKNYISKGKHYYKCQYLAKDKPVRQDEPITPIFIL
jgi:biotin operon repressor